MVKIQTKILLIVLTCLFIAMLVISLFSAFFAITASAAESSYKDYVEYLLAGSSSLNTPCDLSPLSSALIIPTPSQATATTLLILPIDLRLASRSDGSGYYLYLSQVNGRSLGVLSSGGSPVAAKNYAGIIGSTRLYLEYKLDNPVSIPLQFKYFVRLNYSYYFSSSGVVSGLSCVLFFASDSVPFDESNPNSYYMLPIIFSYSSGTSAYQQQFSYLGTSSEGREFYTPFYYALSMASQAYVSGGELSPAYSRGYDIGRSAGYSAGVQDANSTVTESSASYTAGVAQGKTTANNTVTTTSASYTAGFNKGVASSNDYSFFGLLSSVLDVPLNAFSEFFNFELLGVNLTGFFSALFALAVVVTVIRLVLR